jgi:hypothetical protein
METVGWSWVHRAGGPQLGAGHRDRVDEPAGVHPERADDEVGEQSGRASPAGKRMVRPATFTGRA